MKIFHVITSLKIGGAESALFNFLQKSKDDNNQHFVAYFYHGLNVEKINELGIKTFFIKGFFHKYDFVSFYRLKKIIKKINPDIIHSSLWAANLYSKFIAKSLNIPIICSLHSNCEYDGKLRKLIEQPTIYMADKYLAVSNSTKNGFIKTFIQNIKNDNKKKLLLSKIILIKNGIDFNNIQAVKKIEKKDLGFKDNDFIIGTIGRLESIKSYDVLIKAFSRFYNNKVRLDIDAKLCIVGDGSLKKELESLAINLNIKHKVFFTGAHNDAYRFCNVFDCFVLTSMSEGLSISLLEALSFGLPVITTSRDLEHDVVKPGQNGILVPPNNIPKLVHALEVFYLNPDILKRIKKNNLDLVKNEFDLNKMKLAYDCLYDDLVAESSNNFNV